MEGGTTEPLNRNTNEENYPFTLEDINRALKTLRNRTRWNHKRIHQALEHGKQNIPGATNQQTLQQPKSPRLMERRNLNNNV